jgi:hypothetical protein
MIVRGGGFNPSDGPQEFRVPYILAIALVAGLAVMLVLLGIRLLL